jgi:acyl-CoA synthetase (AMP-forming)/AMP-acid ligase II
MPSPSHNIAEILLSRGAAGAAAVFCGRHALTYDELRRQVGGWAAQLLAAGLCPGARIGLLAENGPFFISAYLGTMLAGSCVVPFPLDCSQAAFADMVRSLGIRRLAVSARFLGRIRPWAEPLGLELLTEEEHGPAGPPPHSIAAAVDPHGLAAIMPTSGSTAEPKGVMVTHGNIAANTEAILRYMALTPADRVMVVLPFSYCYGASLLHTHLLAGASLVLNNRFLFPEKVLDEMDQRHCTGLAGVPSTYQILLRKTNFARRTFPALRWLQQAGGRLPNALIEELRRALPAVRLFIMYGQTEGTARLSYLPPDRLHDKLGSIGRGLPGTRLEVLRPDGTPV